MRFGTIGKRHNRAATKLEAARVKAARSNVHWTELDEADLVPRGDVLVSVDTDAIYKPHTGVVFEPGSTMMVADFAPLLFYVTDGEPTFLERVPGTWSEQVARRDHREARRRAAS